MKKTIITIAIVLGISLGAAAQQQGGGLFQRGYVPDEANYDNVDSYRNDGLIDLPGHGSENDFDGPIGSGIALLAGLGAAYAFGKRRKEE